MPRFLILGCAHPHIVAVAEQAASLPDGELVGVWDDDPALAKPLAERFGIPQVPSEAEALALKPDTALIGALPARRAELAAACCAADIGVLVDKPLALTHESLERVKAASEQNAVPVQVFYPYRGHPLLLAAKQALDAGQIGELVRVKSCGPHKLKADTRPGWHFTREGNGGALIDIGSHHADIVQWFVGGAPQQVFAVHANHSQPRHTEFQDYAQATFSFEGGVLGQVEVDWLTVPSMNAFGDTTIWVQGTRGKIEVRLGDEPTARVWDAEGCDQPLEPVLDGADSVSDAAVRWEGKLLADVAKRQPCDIPQDAVWQASHMTLCAFDAAMRGGVVVPMT